LSDIVIKAENLGKRYTIGHQRGRGDQTTFREVLVQNARNLWNKSRDLIGGRPVIAGDTLEEVWALKDVSFEIKRGEAVGIIGRNGAGKSTLLKILSRITEPTTGRVTIKGRVASLLEVGTGFHSELTGRENIYLNGTILGMTRTEIKRKFDEIVAFSEVERYLDTPVKRYSSGMYVRLAFAVAAHLEPEILIVDEVLAVGDAAFQKKCLGKMGDVAQEGRTVLFVSHNMDAITILCNRAILIDKGKIITQGYPAKVIKEYFSSPKEQISYGERIFPRETESSMFIQAISISNKEGCISRVFQRSDTITITVKIEIVDPSFKYHIAIDVKTFDDLLLFRTHSFEQAQSFEILKENGSTLLTCTIPSELFPANIYKIGIITAISGKKELQHIYPALEFEVIQDLMLGDMFMNVPGVLTPKCIWKKLS